MFEALLRLAGMNANDAAWYFGVGRRTVVGWVRGTPAPPEEVVERLYALIAAQEAAAEEIIEAWDASGQPAEHKLRIAANDEEARASGWPSVTAQMVPVAMAQATLTRVAFGFVTDAAMTADEETAGEA